MNPTSTYQFFPRCFWPLLLVVMVPLHGQGTAAVSAADVSPPLAVVHMSPFEVVSPEDHGYRAGASVTGTGTAGLIRDTPLNISIVPQELIRDQAGNQLVD